MSAGAPQPQAPVRGGGHRPPGAHTPFTQAGMLARWSARMIGLLLAALVIAMRFYDRSGAGAWMDPLVVKIGLGLVFAGFLAGWRSDRLAGALILIGVATMVAGTWGMGGPFGAVFALFAAAGLLHLMAALGRRLEQAGRGR